ncbi:response regulator transcription factor [Myroides sp. LJL119]
MFNQNLTLLTLIKLFNFNVFLCLLFFLPVNVHSLTINTSLELPKNTIENLHFEKVNATNSLYLATGKKGHSWLKGYFTKGELYKPVSLQIANPLLLDYDLYVINNSKLIKLSNNLNNPHAYKNCLFPQYNFTPEHQEYYIHLRKQVLQKIPVEIQYKKSNLSVVMQHKFKHLSFFIIPFLGFICNSGVYYFSKAKSHYLLFTALFCLTGCLVLYFNPTLSYQITKSTWLSSHFLILVIPIYSLMATCYIFNITKGDKTSSFALVFNLSIPILCLVYALCYCFILLPIYYLFKGIILLNLLNFFYLFSLVYNSNSPNSYYKSIMFSVVALLAINTTLLIYIAMDYRINYKHAVLIWAILTNTIVILISYLNQLYIKYKIGFSTFEFITGIHNNYRYEKTTILDKKLLKKNGQTHYSLVANPSTDFRLSDCITVAKLEFNLTHRETQILLEIWRELSNKDLANKLFIAPATIKQHTTRIYLKLQVKNRLEALDLRDEYIKRFFNN